MAFYDRNQVGVHQDSIPTDFKKTGIYIISDQHGHIKIGKTTNLGRRLKEIQNGNPFQIKLLYFFDVQKDELDSYEQMFHKEFEKDRLNGEWFNEQPVLDFMIFIMSDIYSHVRVGLMLESKDAFQKEMKRLRNEYYAANYAVCAER